MKAVVAAFNQEKALVGAFSVITNLRMQFGCNFLRHYLHPRSPSLHSLAHLEAPPLPPRPATSKKRLEAGAGPRHGYTSDSADSLHRAASCERNVALLLLTQGILMGHPDILIYSILQCN